MADGTTWLPTDLEQRLLDPVDGPAIRQAFADAKESHDIDELHPLERWRFVIGCFDQLGGAPADPCCCCSRSTPAGAQRMATTDAQWRRAVVATVKGYPGWVPA